MQNGVERSQRKGKVGVWVARRVDEPSTQRGATDPPKKWVMLVQKPIAKITRNDGRPGVAFGERKEFAELDAERLAAREAKATGEAALERVHLPSESAHSARIRLVAVAVCWHAHQAQ